MFTPIFLRRILVQTPPRSLPSLANTTTASNLHAPFPNQRKLFSSFSHSFMNLRSLSFSATAEGVEAAKEERESESVSKRDLRDGRRMIKG